MTRSHWINAKRAGTCGCGARVERTFRILWFPIERRMLCQTCGVRYTSAAHRKVIDRIEAQRHDHATRSKPEAETDDNQSY